MIPWYFKIVLVLFMIENMVLIFISLACLHDFKEDDGLPRFLMGIAVIVATVFTCVAMYGLFTFQFIPN